MNFSLVFHANPEGISKRPSCPDSPWMFLFHKYDQSVSCADEKAKDICQLRDGLTEAGTCITKLQLDVAEQTAKWASTRQELNGFQKQSIEVHSMASSSKAETTEALRELQAQQSSLQGLTKEMLDLTVSSKKEKTSMAGQLEAQKANLQALDQKVLELASSSAMKLVDGLAEVRQACSQKLDSSAQESAAGQAGLQKEAVKMMQRLESLAAQHAAFAERLIAAEARAAGEVSPRGIREVVQPGKPESGVWHHLPI